MLKSSFQSMNKFLQLHLSSKPYQLTILSAFHRWQYQYTISKNMLTMLNRMIKHSNNYHIFRKQWIIGLFAIGIGFTFGQIDNWLIQNFNKDNKQAINNNLINGVLKNQIVSDKLNQLLGKQIFHNKSIQFQLHEVLMQLALKPQQEKLRILLKQAIINSIKSNQMVDGIIIHLVKPNLYRLDRPIIQFLKGENFQGIVTGGLSYVLKTETVQEIIKNGLTATVNNGLSSETNMNILYDLIKQKII